MEGGQEDKIRSKKGDPGFVGGAIDGSTLLHGLDVNSALIK